MEDEYKHIIQLVDRLDVIWRQRNENKIRITEYEFTIAKTIVPQINQQSSSKIFYTSVKHDDDTFYLYRNIL